MDGPWWWLRMMEHRILFPLWKKASEKSHHEQPRPCSHLCMMRGGHALKDRGWIRGGKKTEQGRKKQSGHFLRRWGLGIHLPSLQPACPVLVDLSSPLTFRHDYVKKVHTLELHKSSPQKLQKEKNPHNVWSLQFCDGRSSLRRVKKLKRSECHGHVVWSVENLVMSLPPLSWLLQSLVNSLAWL